MPKPVENLKLREDGLYDTGRPKMWKLEVVIKELDEMYALLIKPSDEKKPGGNIINANSIISIKALCLLRGFSSQRVSEWKSEFSENSEFTERIQKISDLMELRLQYQGMKTPTMPIFLLKNHYGYKDQRQIDGNLQANVIFPQLTIETVDDGNPNAT